MRLMYIGTYSNSAAGSEVFFGWRFDGVTGSSRRCVLLLPEFLLATDKGFDKIVVHGFDTATGSLTPTMPSVVEATLLGAEHRRLAFAGMESSVRLL